LGAMPKMLNLVKAIYYSVTGQRKRLSPLFKFSDRRTYQEWIDEDKYDERTAELIKQLTVKEKREPKNVEFIWCLVGNIVDEHEYGEQKEIKRGTKHFSPGTKVYCFPPQWGDGYEKIKVIGRPRRTTRFIQVVIKSDLITNWRLEKVFSSFIKRKMIKNNGWDDSEDSKERASTLLNSILESKKQHGT